MPAAAKILGPAWGSVPDLKKVKIKVLILGICQTLFSEN